MASKLDILKYDLFDSLPEKRSKCDSLSEKRPVRWEPYNADSDEYICRKIPMAEIKEMKSCTNLQVYDIETKKCTEKGSNSDELKLKISNAIVLEKLAVSSEETANVSESEASTAESAAEAAPDDSDLQTAATEARTKATQDRAAATQAREDADNSTNVDTFIVSPYYDPKIIALLVILSILIWKNRKILKKIFK